MSTASRSGTSREVRELAVRKYVKPNAQEHRQFAIPVRSLLEALKAEGFPPGNTPQICSAIQSRKFLAENQLEIERVDGPPSRQSTTVVVHYRFERAEAGMAQDDPPDKRAVRLARESAGLLQPVVDQFGSADALLLWIRSEDAA